MQSNAQDAFCGRVLVNLPLGSSDPNLTFDVLPPHFHPNEPVFAGGATWTAILPCYDDLPQSFHSVLPYLLASLVRHRDFLDRELAVNHPLRSSTVWTAGFLHDARMLAQVHGGSGTNPVTGLTATGIPPYEELARSLRAMKSQVDRVEASVQQAFRDGLANLQHEVSTRLQDLPEQVTGRLLDNIQVNGAAPLVRADVDAMLRDRLATFEANLLAALAPAVPGPVPAPLPPVPAPPVVVPILADDEAAFPMYNWGGAFHFVPEGFTFTMCARVLCFFRVDCQMLVCVRVCLLLRFSVSIARMQCRCSCDPFCPAMVQSGPQP